MSPKNALLPLAAFALILAAACALHAAGILTIPRTIGEPLEGWLFPFAMSLILAGAAAGAAFPERRAGTLLFISLVLLAALHGPARAAGALVLWAGFYYIVNLRASWWIRGPALLVLHAAPFALAWMGGDPALMGVLLTVHFACGFVLRSALYAYEGTLKKDQLSGAGLREYVLYLTAAPLTALPMSPIGFVTLHRGFRKDVDPALMVRGVKQVLLGFVYVTAAALGDLQGVFPSFRAIYDVVDRLDTLTAAASAHLVLLDMFLNVTGHVHLAVGMLRVLGFDIPSGSDRPYTAENVLHFWRRWNTYYRDWLLTLGYYPVAMALKRRPYLAMAVAGPATFYLMGFAHAMEYYVGRPGEATVRGVFFSQTTSLVYGLVVTAFMLKEMAAARRRRAARAAGAAGGGRPPAGWMKVVQVASIVATVTFMGALMVFFSRPSGVPRSASISFLMAFVRPPAF